MSLSKRILIYVCILLYTYSGISQEVTFEWLNKDLKQFEKFNLSKGEYSFRHFTSNNFETTYSIDINKFDLRDFPVNKSIIVHGFSLNKNTTYFTVPGTGYVFIFDRIQNTFTRIDDTFYRGYNFESVQFFYKGVIYSLGGSGFWNIHSTLAYFDFKRKEWEILETKGDIKPERVLYNLSGVNLAQDKIYVLEAREEFSLHSTRKQRVFELNLNTMTWAYKGDIDLTKLNEYDLTSTQFSWIGNWFYFHEKQENPIFADPETNELFVYKGPKKLFFGNSQTNYSLGNKLYSCMPQYTKGKPSEELDSLTFDEFKRNLVKIGYLYQKNWLPWSIKDISLGFFSIFSLGSFLFIIKRNRRNRFSTKKRSDNLAPLEKSIWELLPPAGIAILDYVMEHGCDYMFTTEEISKLLGCDKKAFDTQRQYRSKFISNFNAFFEEHFMLSDAIYRISSDEDKRFVCYQLSEKVVEEYKSYLNSLD